MKPPPLSPSPVLQAADASADAGLAAPGRPRLAWPAPALLCWTAGWIAAWIAGALGVPALAAVVVGVLVGVAGALLIDGPWRRLIAAAGFPVSALALGVAVPGWAWIGAAALLLLAYPLRAWRDAPWFPTPAGALAGLAEAVGLPPGARVLDAGCGLGHGLRALRDALPLARLEGVEWSRPLALACRWRCPDAQVRRGDLWSTPWQGLALVYLFQRPESMVRAWDKACAELDDGAWFVSLEFAVPGVVPHARLAPAGGRPVWVYRLDGATRRSIGAPLRR